MQMVLIGLILLCGYFYLYQLVASKTANKASLPVIAIVLLVIYAIISVSLVLIISQMGSMDYIVLSMLVLITCIGIASLLYGLVKNFRRLNKTVLVLFVLFLLMVSYITIFSRSERSSTVILVSFDSIQEAIQRRSLEPLEHLMMNVVMFIPLGALFALLDPGHTDKWRYVLPLGLILTTVIETTQLLLRLGHCDLEDLFANTLGACIGLLLVKIYLRFRPASES